MTDSSWLLYDNPLSGNCWKVRQLLTLLEVPFRSEEVSVLGDRDKDRAASPVGRYHAGRIPLLVAPDGRCMAESNAILLELAEGSRWMPAGSDEQQQVREWLFFEQGMHMPNLAGARYLQTVVGIGAEQPEVLGYLQGRARIAMGRLEKRLAGRSWLVGSSWSIADLALYPYTRMAAQGGIALGGCPAVSAWLRRVEAEPGFLPLPCPVD